MHYPLSLTILLLAGTAVSAQTHSGSSAAVSIASTKSLGCPIGFNVKRQSGLVARSAKYGPEDAIGQKLQLTFDRLDAPKITKATVTVHGISGHAAYLPTHSGDSTGDVSETFILERGAGTTSLYSAEILAHRIEVVRWVELTGMDYADGSQWHTTKESQCGTEVGLLLLTSSR